MRKFLIETTYSHDDEDFDGDFYNMRLVDEHESEIMDGDYYHDKIEEKIEGFFECLDYLGIKYKKEKIKRNAAENEY